MTEPEAIKVVDWHLALTFHVKSNADNAKAFKFQYSKTAGIETVRKPDHRKNKA